MRKGPYASARALLCLTLSSALLLQGLVPAGYMPAAVERGGWVVQLCPEGLPEAFLGRSDLGGGVRHQHHGLHGETTGGQHEAGAARDYCPLGSAFDTAALAELASATAPDSALPPSLPPGIRRAALAARLLAGQARAPPTS